MIRKILFYPDPALRQVAATVNEITPDIISLLDDMLETMYDAPGIGLAGNQIGVLKRLVVIDIQSGRDGVMPEIYKMINPKILETSDLEDGTPMEEGCLSIPGIAHDITRPDWIRFEYQDINGETHTQDAEGLLAKAVQHEIDHLDGRLFVDYLSRLKRDSLLRKSQKYVRDQQKQQTTS